MKSALLAGTLGACLALPAGASGTLVGFARMNADTFSGGPTSGQLAGPGTPGHELPLADRQPVQGFSAVLAGPVRGTYYFLTDNGFGARDNSADALLRLYAVRPDFRTATGGAGSIDPVDFATGAPLPSFSSASYITLYDADHRLHFPIQAERDHYLGDTTKPEVSEQIRQGRLLTGADLDVESICRDSKGHYWIGDEFGPFLIETDDSGKLLRDVVSLPGVRSPQNPDLDGAEPNLASSGGFEGMAIDPRGERLYALLEKTVTGDPPHTLRLYTLGISEATFAANYWRYPLEPEGTAIGDMAAVNDRLLLVIERNHGTATSGPRPFKRIYQIRLPEAAGEKRLEKELLLDLMDLADPNDLNGDGSERFTFPFVTIENLLILDEWHLLVANDNNYPSGGGRGQEADATEVIVVRLDRPLPLADRQPGVDHRH